MGMFNPKNRKINYRDYCNHFSTCNGSADSSVSTCIRIFQEKINETWTGGNGGS